jgi:hypothetical protein
VATCELLVDHRTSARELDSVTVSPTSRLTLDGLTVIPCVLLETSAPPVEAW